MAGRGCSIVIKLLGGSNGQGETEDISLPVALHSPLEVLKQQLHHIVAITPRDQVLILCDLSDPERNSDRLLTELDNLSLHECGIRNGSVLTLHAISMSAERKQRMITEAFSSTVTEIDNQRRSHCLSTPITAAQANHSYNGIIFDIMCLGPYEIEVYSVSIAGMLGRVRVFGRNCGWEDDKPAEPQTQHWWAHRDPISRTGWECVADKICRPSWDKPIEIRFSKPLIIGPHQRKALYCHSGLPDDLGIQYQSFSKKDIVAEDEHIRLLPGVGHTGSEPFDDVHGWYRSYRGLAGSVSYYMRWKGWSPRTHLEFPVALRTAVKTMLLCNLCSSSSVSTASSSTATFSHDRTTSPGYRGVSGESAAAVSLQPSPSTGRYPRLDLSSLPVYVIYNILEFMNYDWFSDEVEKQCDEKQQEISNLAAIKRRIRSILTSNYGGNAVQMLHQIGIQGGLNVSDIVEMMYFNNTENGEGVDADDDDYFYGLEEEEDEEEDDDDEVDDEEDEEYDDDEAFYEMQTMDVEGVVVEQEREEVDDDEMADADCEDK